MNPKQRHWLIFFGLLLVLAGSILVLGCESQGRIVETDVTTAFNLAQMEDEQSSFLEAGAKLWEQNCIRCHNIRTPSSLNDTQWKVVMHHMRVRAGLTAAEHEAILRFLQAAN